MTAEKKLTDFTLAYYSGDRKTGSVAIVDYRNGAAQVKRLDVAQESGLDKPRKPVFVGLTEDHQIIELDPVNKTLNIQDAFTADAFPAHIYSDPHSERDWFMNDGDKESGNDTLNCGDQGSSVTVVEHANRADARFLKTICVGRGHHQATFSYPSSRQPDVPAQAYISNLKDGTISVIGNDPDKADSYLNVIATIDLLEADKEKTAGENNAFPHGLVYSKLSGKVYNLNNGYGTIAIIDPHTHQIEQRIALKGFSNLFMSPDGRHIIARGADRKSDPAHVIAKLAVIDVTTNEVVSTAELPDIYISKYYFNPEGTRLYLTTSSKGNPEQEANLKDDVMLVFDVTALPEIRLLSEVSVGASGSLSFLNKSGSTELIFSSDAENGAVVVIDGANHIVLESLPVGDQVSHSRAWLLAG
jgi:DNA-binding beta-propeller fold protein YncE